MNKKDTTPLSTRIAKDLLISASYYKLSLGIIMVIMEPEDIYEMLMDIYMQNYIEDEDVDKYIKEAALFYREVSKPL